ncbi:hypothetical protein CO658_004544, partial [Salmonella enterica subsp. arizonae serovar 41:z4,z23:- str. 01-0089]|nr:hypothetical protein [Salmonella enterica subsp. arizonae serovar 41:z4,z23:- str. 01-0089]
MLGFNKFKLLVHHNFFTCTKQPIGFFRNLINSLYEAATGDTRTSHALVKHNYQRLLDKI